MTISFEELRKRLWEGSGIGILDSDHTDSIRIPAGIHLDRTDIINLAKYFGITAEDLEDDHSA